MSEDDVLTRLMFEPQNAQGDDGRPCAQVCCSHACGQRRARPARQLLSPNVRSANNIHQCDVDGTTDASERRGNVLTSTPSRHLAGETYAAAASPARVHGVHVQHLIGLS